MALSPLGTRMTVLIGPKVAIPLAAPFTEAVAQVEVTERARGRSGFQLAFHATRGDPANPVDFTLLASRILKPFNRVVIMVTVGPRPIVLMDGFITHVELDPGRDGSGARVLATGEDVCVLMDLEEKIVEHPAQNDMMIANKILLKYASYGLVSKVVPPPTLDQPIPIERTPVQRGTDLEYLLTMASRYGYEFYIQPGPLPNTGMAYWGPPARLGLPQPALSVNMGAQSNVDSLSFRYRALEPKTVKGLIQDARTNLAVPVLAPASTWIPMTSQPALLAQRPNVRQRLPKDLGGLNAMQAGARALGRVNASTDAVVEASGELDALRYGSVLRARSLVGVRGVGMQFGGTYYTRSVTHVLKPGQYTQKFVLTRDGAGTLLPVVRP